MRIHTTIQRGPVRNAVYTTKSERADLILEMFIELTYPAETSPSSYDGLIFMCAPHVFSNAVPA